MRKVRIVTATTKNQMEFSALTLLGQSLERFPKKGDVLVSVFHSNSGSRRRGLSDIYNTFLQPGHENEILLFVHDDVYLNDWHLVYRLNEALNRFDVVGLAGNTAPDFDEPSWMLAWNRGKYPRGRQPSKNLSGVVGHLVQGKTIMSVYGDLPRECKLLDGLFLAVDAKKIIESPIRFDSRFEYHFYDLDFCRQCLAHGLKLGTWPISATHGSGGVFGTPEWMSARDQYLLKWG